MVEVRVPALPLAWVSYGILEEGRNRQTAYALAMAVPAPDGVEGTLWIASLPGVVFPAPDPGVGLYPVQGEFLAIENHRRNVYEGVMVARDEMSGLVLILADCSVDPPPPPLSSNGLAGTVRALVLDTDWEDLIESVPNARGGISKHGRKVESLRDVALGSPLQAGQAFHWPDAAAVAAVQTLAPVFNPAGECAGWLIRAQDDSWRAAAIPDIGAMTAEINGPFDVAARVNGRGDELEIEFDGRFSPGLRRGRFAIALGQETDALQGFDGEGRRYLVDLLNPDRSKLKVDSLRVDEATGLHRARIRLKVSPDAGEHVLVGQMLQQAVDSRQPALPYPPFTIRVRGGAGGGIEVTGNDAFRPKQSERSGRSENPLVAGAEVIELPAAVMPNRAIFTGNRLILPTAGMPAVWIHEVADGALASLSSGLSGDDLVVAADSRRAFLLDRQGGVIEAWNLDERALVSAGLVDGAGEVLAMAVLESGDEELLVLACRDRFRFLTVNGFTERMPCLAPLNRPNSEFEDGYEMFGNDVPLERAVALRAAQGGLVAFRGAPHFGAANHPVNCVVVAPHEHAGRLDARIVPGVAALGPFGITYLWDDAMRESDAIEMSRPNAWSGGGRSASDGMAIAGCFVGPLDLDPVFILRRIEGSVPAAPPVLEARSRNRPNAEPVMLGGFPELSGCGTDLAGGGPLFSHHLFPVPERGLLLTLDDEGRRIYRRTLDTAALLAAFGGNSFTVLANAPGLLRRGLPFHYQLAVTGANEPGFKLIDGPEDAAISAEGILHWPNPADHPADEITIRVEVADGDSGRSLPWVMTAKLIGALRTRAVSSADEPLAGDFTPRIHAVPMRGLIREKVEADFERLHVLVTETPAGGFRLEVFDAAAETWMPGTDLPGLPAEICANPEIIYLLYPDEAVLEIRKTGAPGDVRRIPLKLPVAAMGCSADTTEGVFCLAERLNPEVVKVGDFVDWDGTRVTITRSQGAKARFVFLSPLTLRPVPVAARQEDLDRAVFFLGTGDASRVQRIAVSSDGWRLSVPHFALDLNGGKGPARLYGNPHHSGAAWFTDGGKVIYPGSHSRLELKAAAGGQEARYETVERAKSSRINVVPVSNRDLEIFVEDTNAFYKVGFHSRSTGEHLFTVGPLPEIRSIGHDRPNPELGKRLAMVHDNKLVSVGHRRRQIFVRDLPLE